MRKDIRCIRKPRPLVECLMIVDILWVLLVALILLNLRQYRKEDIETFQASLYVLRRDLFIKVNILEALLREPSGDTRNDRGDAYYELNTLRGELAIIISRQKRGSESVGHSVSEEAAVNPETEGEQTIHAK